MILIFFEEHINLIWLKYFYKFQMNFEFFLPIISLNKLLMISFNSEIEIYCLCNICKPKKLNSPSIFKKSNNNLSPIFFLKSQKLNHKISACK